MSTVPTNTYTDRELLLLLNQQVALLVLRFDGIDSRLAQGDRRFVEMDKQHAVFTQQIVDVRKDMTDAIFSVSRLADATAKVADGARDHTNALADRVEALEEAQSIDGPDGKPMSVREWVIRSERKHGRLERLVAVIGVVMPIVLVVAQWLLERWK